MIPLYGFLEGDTLGLLILAYETDTVEVLAEKLQVLASVRVASRAAVNVLYKGQILAPQLLLTQTNIEPLDRIDVRRMDNPHGI